MSYTIEQIAKEIYDANEVLDYNRKTIDELRNEQFENIGQVHDWRNYISGINSHGWQSKNLANWQAKTDLQMLIAYALAIVEADAENWD